MRRRILAVGLAVVAVLGGVALVGGSQQEAPNIEPKADQYLKAMSSYLAGLKTYSFQVEEFIDEVQDDGQKIQLSNQRHMSVSRPDKVFGEDEGDTANSLFYYDGKTVTVFDRGQKTYATEKVPGTIDAMLDDLHDRFDTHQTLADFLFSDPYKVFTENVQSGTYVGLHHVGKVKCHHLAFRQKILDWQIWIDAGDTAAAAQAPDHLQAAGGPTAIHGPHPPLGREPQAERRSVSVPAAGGCPQGRFPEPARRAPTLEEGSRQVTRRVPPS